MSSLPALNHLTLSIEVVKRRREKAEEGWALKSSVREKEDREDQESRQWALARRYDKLARYHWMQAPAWRSTSLIDFTLENPAGGKLWLQDCVRVMYDDGHASPLDADSYGTLRKELLDPMTEFRNTGMYPCTRLTTSYCRYGTTYQKPTSILTSISGLALLEPCSTAGRCSSFDFTENKHRQTVQETTNQAERNQIPQALTFALLDAFVAKHRARNINTFLVLDLFSGWGSVSRAAKDFATQMMTITNGRNAGGLVVFTNDLVRTRANHHETDLDLSMQHGSGMVQLALRFALVCCAKDLEAAGAAGDIKTLLQKHDTIEAVLQSAGIAVLVHCSFPCTTYSLASGGTHRKRKTHLPCSAIGSEHDSMLCELLLQLRLLCKLAPVEAVRMPR